MKSLFIKTYNLIDFCLKHPLSLLRIALPVLVGKKVYGGLEYIDYLEYNDNYAYGKTWFLDALPASFFSLDYSEFMFLKQVLLLAIIGSIIGFLGRINLLILAFFSFLSYGMGEVYGIFDHHISLPTQVILALALVPGSMKISIDQLIINLIKKIKKLPLTSSTPNWGFKLVLALVLVTYFTAGVSKIRYGGLKWLDGSTLSFYLKERTEKHENGNIQLIIGDSSIKDEDKWKDKFGFVAHTYGNYQSVKKWNDIADYIANNKLLVILLSIGSVLFELLAFIAFYNSKYRNIYLISAILFHLSIGQLMGISFRQYRLICFLLIDWKLIIDTLLDKLKIERLVTGLRLHK